jgi:hypothetical protein
MARPRNCLARFSMARSPVANRRFSSEGCSKKSLDDLCGKAACADVWSDAIAAIAPRTAVVTERPVCSTISSF